MSGFIATGGAEPFILTNVGFFPDVDAEHLRASLRIDASVTNARLEVAAVNAMLSVNRELLTYKHTQQAAGYASLAAIPSDQVNGANEQTHLYRRAVYCTAGAELAERYRSYDATAAGNQRAEELTPSVDEYRRDARWAIRELLGERHTTVELI